MTGTDLTARHRGDNASPPPPLSAVLDLERIPDPGSEQYGLVRLNRNERVQPLPDWFVAQVRDAISGDLLTGYPTTDELYGELSTSLEVDEERLLVTAGSDGAIKAIYQAWLRSGDEVLMLAPSYAMYRVYAQMFQARAVEINFDHSLQLDVKHLLESIRPGVRLVMIANPNQPTGTSIDEPTLLKVLERAREIGALVAVDEAYYPFSKFTILPSIHEFTNLLVIRTFSKAAGLAGLRIGFVAGHPEVVANLSKVRSVHDVNAVAAVCAREVLRHPEIVADCVRQVDEGKRILASRVLELGLEPVPTQANFMLIKIAQRCPPEALVDALRERGYIVRGPFSAACISDCIRVTLGPPSLMVQFADALTQALASLT